MLYFANIWEFLLLEIPTPQRIPEDDLGTLALDIWNDGAGVYQMILPPISIHPDEYMLACGGNPSEIENLLKPGQYNYRLWCYTNNNTYAEGMLQFGLTPPEVSQHDTGTHVVSYEPNTEIL